MKSYKYTRVWDENAETLAEMIGKTFVSVEHEGDSVLFDAGDGTGFVMLHEQDCCESVEVEEIHGDLSDLIGAPILLAEESCPDLPAKDGEDSFTWTFYRFATAKGYVTIRWYGSSNGYYSERVNVNRVEILP